MSNVNDIYNKIRAAIPTLTGFSTKTEIPRPGSLGDNPETLLRNGWGIVRGDASIDTATDNPEYTMITEFRVVITKKFFTTDSNSDPYVTAVQSLYDDLATIQDDFTLTRFSIADKVEFVNIVTITGVEDVVTDKQDHISASIVFGITHWK